MQVIYQVQFYTRGQLKPEIRRWELTKSDDGINNKLYKVLDVSQKRKLTYHFNPALPLTKSN